MHAECVGNVINVDVMEMYARDDAFVQCND